MLYFLGGKSQAGKSEISKEVKKRKPNLIVIEADRCRVWKTGHDPDEGGWDSIVSYIKSLGDKDDILIEGVAVTPERVRTLKTDYPLKAAFIGFGNEEYVNAWIKYAREHPCGYLAQEEVRRKAAGERSQFATFQHEVQSSNDIKERAEKLGHRYFGMTEPPSFGERIKPVIDYLLED